MEDLTTILIGTAWIAILGMLLWGIASGWRRQLISDLPLPFFRRLERDGVTLAAAEAVIGINELAHAASRCATCAARPSCERGGFVRTRPEGCPNAPLFERLGRRGAVS